MRYLLLFLVLVLQVNNVAGYNVLILPKTCVQNTLTSENSDSNVCSCNRYAYALFNPLKYIDPTGESMVDFEAIWEKLTSKMKHTIGLDRFEEEYEFGIGDSPLDDWVQNKTSKLVHWDKDATSPGTTKEEDTYIGKTVFAIDIYGRFRYGDQFGNWHDMAPLADTKISANLTSHEQAMNAKQTLHMYEYSRYRLTIGMPWDMVGVQFSGNLFSSVGWGVDVTVGYVKKEGGFASLSLRPGAGGDASVGAGVITGKYYGDGKPSSSQLSGVSFYGNGGSGGWYYTYSQSIMNDGSNPMWTTHTIGYSFGTKTIISGSGGFSITTPPLKFLQHGRK